MKRILLSILTAAAFSFPALAQGPAVPVLVNYQAYLTDNSSMPYGNSAATNYDVKFQLYTATTGGTAVWAELQTVTISVGQLSVLLGNGTQVGAISHANLDVIFGPNSTVAAGSSLYIGITVNAVGANTAAEFVPRQQIISNPLTLRAKFADTAQTVAAGGITSAAFASGSVNAASIADGSIVAAELADNSVTSAKIAADTIVAGDIAANAVTATELAADAVTFAKIAAETITSADIAAGAVTASEILDGTVGAAELGSQAVTSDKIADNTITTTDIATDAVGADEADFASMATSSISFFRPVGVSNPANANPSFSIHSDTVTGGRFQFTAYPIGLGSHTAQIYYDTQGFLRIQRNVGDPGAAKLDNGGNWQAPSDERLKKSITPASGLLSKALRIQPVYYHWKTEAGTEPQHFGVIAQNVADALPDLVSRGETWAVNYAGLGVVAIGAIQEQQVMLKDQDGRLEMLEKENADLKARLERLEQALGTIK